MNDLSALLDAAQSTDCGFLGQTIKLEVYTAGPSRLTHEETKTFQEIIGRYRAAHDRASEIQKAIKASEILVAGPATENAVSESVAVLQKELDDLDTGSVEIMRVVLPFMLKGWSLNGEPMKRNGVDYPPTTENLATVPDNLLLAVGEAAQVVWQNPSTAESVAGSAAEEKPDSSPTETTMPSVT